MDANEIRKWHSIFKREDELFEIRLVGGGDTPWSGYFYDIEDAITQLHNYDNFNIYFTVNEVKKACDSRSQFGMFQKVKGTATSKQDIEHRWWIPIDVDCERPSGVSSTDAEKEMAYKRAGEVYKFLLENNFSSPVVCDSSSGYHIYIPIDMDNTNEAETSLKTFLEVLATKFTDDHIKIDTVLYDANRIIRLPGSFGRKGRSTPDRPHRMAKILYVPDNITRVKMDFIDAFNDKYKIKEEQPQRQYQNYNNHNAEAFNLRSFIREHGIDVAKEIPLPGGGTKYVLTECIFDSGHKAPDAAIFEMPNGAIAYKCFHQSCAHHDWREVRLKFDPHAYDYENRPYQPQAQQQRQYTQQKQEVKKPQIKEVIPELGDKWLTMSQIEDVDPSTLPGFKTGFTELDRNILKLYEGEITILSGNNASGKTSWLNTLMLNVMNQGVKCALWSGELKGSKLKSWIQQAAAGKANLKPSQYNDGKYYVPPMIRDRITEWMDDKFFLYNNKYGSKWEQILYDMKILVEQGVKLFVLDNLFSLDIDILEGDKNNKQKGLILQLKNFVDESGAHVILVAHPRKVMSFLRKNDICGSSDIQNAADNILIAHRVNQDFFRAGAEFFGKQYIESFRDYGNVIEVAKNRQWGVVDLLVGLHYEIESRRFKNSEYEAVAYGWEREPQQANMDFSQSSPSERRNSVHERIYGGESRELDEAMPFAPPPMDANDEPF